MRVFAFLAMVVLPVACAARSAPSGGKSAARSPVAKGTWGGDHAVLEATGSGAEIQFDCAHGRIPRPLAVDADGGFDLAGELVREHGGPIRVGEEEKRSPVRYSGRVRGKTMTLSVDLGDDQGRLGPFTLELGNEGRIVRCR